MGDANNGKSLKDQFVDAVISSGGPMGYWEAKLDRIARNTGWAMPETGQEISGATAIAAGSRSVSTAKSFVSSIDGQTAQQADERADMVKDEGVKLADERVKVWKDMSTTVEMANSVITNLRNRQDELPGNRLNGAAVAAVRVAQAGAIVAMPAVSLTVAIVSGWADPVAEINKKLEANREEKAKQIYQETVNAFNDVPPVYWPGLMRDPDPIPGDDGRSIHEPIEDVTDTGGTSSDTGVSDVGGVPNSVNIGGGATGSGSDVRPGGTPLGNGAYDINGDGIADYYDYNGDGVPDRWVNGGGAGANGGANGAQTPGSASGADGTDGSYPPVNSDDTRVNYPGTPATPDYPGYPGRPDYPDYPGRPGQDGTIPGTPGANYPSVPPSPGYPGQTGYPGGAAYPSGTVYPSGGAYPDGAAYSGDATYPGWSSTSVDSGMSGGGLSSLPGAGVAGGGVGLSGAGAHGGFGAGASLGAGLGVGATAGGLGTLAAVGGNGSFFTNTPVGATVTNPAGMAGATGLAKGLKTGAAGAAAAGTGAAGRGGMMGAPGAAGAGDKDRKRQGLGLMAPKLDDDDDVALRSAGMMAGHRVKKA